jgi:hypothetical protein
VLSYKLVLLTSVGADKNSWCWENPCDCSHIYKIIQNIIHTYGISFVYCAYELISLNV